MNTMKTTPAETDYAPKRHGYRFWIGGLTLLLGLPLLMYYGYCWGLWGRSNLLLQYLFQCNCPPASEEARYPAQIDVLVSACRHVSSRLLPNGNLLYVREEKSEITTTYLLDLQTEARIEVTDQPFSSFLTDELFFVKQGIEDYILDRTSGTQYPIKIFRFWQENAYENGEPNLELLISALQQAEQVFFTQDNDIVVVLMPNFPTNLEQNFTFDRSDIPGRDSNKVEQFLRENNIDYQTVNANYPHEVVSPNGNLVARDDGIYVIETNQKIAKAPPSLVRGWTSDGRSVIYSSSGRCLIRRGLPFSDDIGCAIQVPQPVLKVKVPEEYLLPAQIP
jgi:hypothetical protein